MKAIVNLDQMYTVCTRFNWEEFGLGNQHISSCYSDYNKMFIFRLVKVENISNLLRISLQYKLRAHRDLLRKPQIVRYVN